MPPPNVSKTVTFDALHAFAKEAFQAAGLSDTDASTGADVLATTDAWGVFTHGTKALAGYLRRLKAGLHPRGVPRVVAEGGRGRRSMEIRRWAW